ncbi:unnamed protein product, partial [Darwinula stevensoni]
THRSRPRRRYKEEEEKTSRQASQSQVSHNVSRERNTGETESDSATHSTLNSFNSISATKAPAQQFDLEAAAFPPLPSTNSESPNERGPSSELPSKDGDSLADVVKGTCRSRSGPSQLEGKKIANGEVVLGNTEESPMNGTFSLVKPSTPEAPSHTTNKWSDKVVGEPDKEESEIPTPSQSNTVSISVATEKQKHIPSTIDAATMTVGLASESVIDKPKPAKSDVATNTREGISSPSKSTKSAGAGSKEKYAGTVASASCIDAGTESMNGDVNSTSMSTGTQTQSQIRTSIPISTSTATANLCNIPGPGSPSVSTNHSSSQTTSTTITSANCSGKLTYAQMTQQSLERITKLNIEHKEKLIEIDKEKQRTVPPPIQKKIERTYPVRDQRPENRFNGPLSGRFNGGSRYERDRDNPRMNGPGHGYGSFGPRRVPEFRRMQGDWNSLDERYPRTPLPRPKTPVNVPTMK